jgi:hypothetical protein
MADKTGADDDRSFDPTAAPTSADVTRGLEQGLGVGQRELDAQREPLIDPPLLDTKPEDDWGDPADQGATYSAKHAIRGEKTAGQNGQGTKTRTANKDTVSRR